MKHPLIPPVLWRRYNRYFILENFLGREKMLKRFGKGRLKLDQELAEALQGNPEYPTQPVLQLGSKPTLQEFLKHRHRPIVFKGMATEWGCCRNWTFDFFKGNYGDTLIHLNDNTGFIDYNNPQEFEELRLEDYIDQMKNGSLKYFKFDRDLLNGNPELKDDLDLEFLRSLWIPRSFREEMAFFMSGKGTMTPMHCAPSSNFFIQVAGQKIWSMFPAEDMPLIDARTRRSYYYYTKVDPDRRDDPQFPLLKYATLYQITLEKGDVLWVPPFAWHHIVNPTPAIGVSYRFMSLSEAFRNSTLMMSLIFFANKPHPLKHLYISIFQKRTAIFAKREADL